VIDTLLADKTFTPRAVTRNASSDAAKLLASRGAEVVEADLWDRESVKRALVGCEAVFGVRSACFYDIASADTRCAGHELLGSQHSRRPG
jgi:uncharacterized protein YbjT (DUF2867 family)